MTKKPTNLDVASHKLIFERKKEILKIENQQKAILKKIEKLVKPAKSFNVQLKRSFKIVELAILLRQLQFQKHVLAIKPFFPNHPKGTDHKPGCLAIVGESGPEIIISKE